MRFAIRSRATGACLALLVAVSAYAPGIQAQKAAGRDAVSEDAAVALVREQTNGKVVRVDRKVEGGSVVYHIRVLTPDGRLREYRVDAATGSMR